MNYLTFILKIFISFVLLFVLKRVYRLKILYFMTLFNFLYITIELLKKKKKNIYIYIYIYRERERERERIC
jgi:hypothetical protein